MKRGRPVLAAPALCVSPLLLGGEELAPAVLGYSSLWVTILRLLSLGQCLGRDFPIHQGNEKKILKPVEP